MASSAPGQSSPRRVALGVLSATPRSVIQTTASAMGTLMKKTQRHEACWTSHPPRTGPAAVVMDVKADQVPMARPSCSRGNETLMSARLLGTRSAPPMPCTPRATISWPTVGANPHHAEAPENRTTPVMKTLRCP